MNEDISTDDVLEGLLGPNGPVATALGRAHTPYEPRPQQLAMAEAVDRALSSSRHLVVEAGTGVGKSFAYLVPLLRWARRAGATVAVATSTIALQEQLVRKDLPLLQDALPFDVSFAIVKGRSNYVCLRRLHRAREAAATLFDASESGTELEAIRAWAVTTTDGSRQDLPFRPSAEIWKLVQAEQGNCKGRACPHHARCHYQRSRRRAHAVRLLVLNHHVLMADLALRRSGASFLPDVDALVIDEAHDLEDTAAEHLGARLSSLGTAMALGRLWRPGRRRGLLRDVGPDALKKAVGETRNVSRRFFGLVGDWAADGADGGGLTPIDEHLPFENTLSPRLRGLGDDVASLARDVTDLDVGMELMARARQLDGAADALDAIAVPREGEVRWVERGARGRVSLASAPVDVGPLLDQVLWSAYDTVVLTSATLATGRPLSFAFLRERLGLRDVDELSVGSPFDYETQARIRVRRDLPDPVSAPAAYEGALPEAVLEAVRLSDGGSFVLFTGYGAMRRTVEALRETLAADGLEVLVQGEGRERPALLERFREGAAVLFGVASFWQGVDVPGDALRHVVIARLPFDVPTHPLQLARQAKIEAEGRSAFGALSLPTAALRLKQGFGRLIRRRSDRGVVTILDPRIRSRGYGRYLLQSLPPCPIEEVVAPATNPEETPRG